MQGDRCALVRDSTTTAILSELRSATIVGTSRFGLSIEELILQHGKEGGLSFTLRRFSSDVSETFLSRTIKRTRANDRSWKSANLGGISLNTGDSFRKSFQVT